jgi:excisionase family DNA binding protein
MTDLLSVRDAAAIIGKKKRMVLVYIENGELPAFRLGNAYVVAKCDALAFVEKREAKKAAKP